MADLRSTSPALRPQLAQRNSSTQSLSRASPSALTSTSHKGSTQKSHKAHGVGHGRHPHNRLPSYGKNLNRLAKASAAQGEEGESNTRHHTRTQSQTPSTSPTTHNVKRNSSKVNLPRTGSKVNAKRNSSGINLQNRNGSATKLGKAGRAEKLHSNLSKAKNKFSVGDDEQDDEWTEESRSQSPEVVRQGATVPKPHNSTGPPSPHDPRAQSPSKLLQPPPRSPPQNENSFANLHVSRQSGKRPSRPADARAVTSRLLSHSNAAPQLTSVSAAVTPMGSSPAFPHTSSDATTLVNTNPSLGADGVSRFLEQNGSAASATLGPVSQLQSTLTSLHQGQQHHQTNSPRFPSSGSPPSQRLLEAQRARSDGDLLHQLGSSSSRSPSPPRSRIHNTNGSRTSPFESFRPAGGRKIQEASRSLTQLKLDLQRQASTRESERSGVPPPLLQSSHSTLAVGNVLAVGAEGETEKRIRQYEQAGRELANATRFEDVLGKALGRLEKRGLLRKAKQAEEGKKDAVKIVSGSTGRGSEDEGGRTPSRGRVRFEVGRMDVEEDDEGPDGQQQRTRALLRRMWDGDGAGR